MWGRFSRSICVLLALILFCFIAQVLGQCAPSLVLDAEAGFISTDYSVIPPEPSQVLTSANLIPNGPLNPYNASSTCTWELSFSGYVYANSYGVHDNNTQVELIFQQLKLAPQDKLEVFEGIPPAVTLLKTYTEADNAMLPANVIATTAATMYVVFTAGPTAQAGYGFGAYFQAGGSMYGVYSLTRPSNTITSGNPIAANIPYSNKQNSGYLIHSEDPGGLISLTYFAVVEAGYDYVTFYDGPDIHSPRIAQTTGENNSRNNGSLLSTTPDLYITWTSDKSSTRAGWIIDYSITTSSCSGTRVLPYTADIFSDESSDNDYAPGTDCSWLIQPNPSVGLIDLFFLSFGVAPGDSLFIYEGTTTSGRVLAQYSGYEIPKRISYFGDAILVRLVASSTSPGASGFTAVYHAGTCLATPKIGAVEGTSGWITDGSGNSTYKNLQDCYWLFTINSLSNPPPTISFSFAEFNLEWYFDRLTIYDGTETTSPVLFQYSGQVDVASTPLTGRTTGPTMLIHFRSDFRDTYAGWNMTYQANLPVDNSSGPDIPLIVGLSVGLGGFALCCLLILILIIIALLILRIFGTPKVVTEEIRFELKEPNFVEVTWPKKEKKGKEKGDGEAAEDDDKFGALTEKQIRVLDKFILNGTVALAFADLLENIKLAQLKKIAEAMVTVYHKHEKATRLIENLLLYELEGAPEETMMLKETLALRCYVVFARLVGIPYIWSLFAYPVADLDKRNTKKANKKDAMRSDSFFSLDTNVEVGEEEDNEEQAIRILQIQLILQKLLTHIIASVDEFPLYLRYLLYRIYIKIRSRFPEKYSFIMGNLIFHRFVCPPLALPVSYGLIKSSPHPSTLKSLILIARVLSNLGKGGDFAAEPALEPLNDFLEENKEKVLSYMHLLCGQNQKPLAGDPPSSVVPGSALKAARETLYSFILVHGEEIENKLREFPSYKIQNPLRWLSYLLGDDNKSVKSASDIDELSDTEGSERLDLLGGPKDRIV